MKAKALKTSLFLSLLFLVVYGGTNTLAAHRLHVGSFYFAWEHRIPFVAWTIIPYMSIDLFFLAAPFLCRNEQELQTLARRVAAAILISGLCFLLFPLRFAFGRPVVAEFFGVIFDSLRGFDQPFNQFPSLHIALAVLLAQVYLRRTRGVFRLLTAAWFGLIVVSTLLTFQHHAIDLVGGFALAVVCIYFFPDRTMRLPTTGNRPVGIYYGMAAIVIAFFSFVARPAGLLLLWPALSLAIIASGYFGVGSRIFRKYDGRLTRTARIILWPVLFGQHLSWLYYRRQCNPWDMLTENVWIGRRLTDREAESAVDAGVSAVVDLTGEFNAARAFLRNHYLHIPVLDLTAPTDEQLETAVHFIQRHSADGVVYIHCKVGYSRTAAVAGAFLMASGRTGDPREAIALLRSARPSIIIRPEARDSLFQYHARLQNMAGRALLKEDVADEMPVLISS